MIKMRNLRTFALLMICLQVELACTNANACRKCMTNGAYCLDQQSFHRCYFNGLLPDTSQVHNCEENEVCSMAGRICVDRSHVKVDNIACEKSLGCNECPEIYKWPTALTCVSATTYRMCEPEGVNSNNTKIECPAGLFCSQAGYQHTGLICLSADVLQELTYKITCQTSGSNFFLPSQTELFSSCEEFRADKYVECFNDPTCKSFIKCRRHDDGILEAVVENCADGYYVQSGNKCLLEKPQNCSDF